MGSLAETAVCAGILALIAGAVLGAAAGAMHARTSQSVRDALAAAVRNELRTAIDVLKYDDAAIGPATIATSVPMPAGSPLPATLAISAQTRRGGGIAVTISASARDGSGETVTLGATVESRAPLPGERVLYPVTVPAPTGAP